MKLFLPTCQHFFFSAATNEMVDNYVWQWYGTPTLHPCVFPKIGTLSYWPKLIKRINNKMNNE